MESEVKINLNRCTPEQLCSFDTGLPFNLAHKIIAYRRRKGDFQSVEDVLNVRGVGLKTYRRLKKKVFVSPGESLPSFSDRSTGNDGSRRVKRRSTRIRNFLENRPNIQENLLDGQYEATKACWRDITTCHQDGLIIFLKGGSKDYSKELDKIQITFTPKRGDRENSSTGSLMKKGEYNICHSCSQKQDALKVNEVSEASDVSIDLNEERGHSLSSSREVRDLDSEISTKEYVTPRKAPEDTHPTSWENDRFVTPLAPSHQFGSVNLSPIARPTQTDTPDEGFIREDQTHKGKWIQTCESDESVTVEKEDMDERSWVELSHEKPDTPVQHDDESLIDDASTIRTPKRQIPAPMYETNSTPVETNDHQQTAHHHSSSRRRHQSINRDVPRCFRHGHPKRCKCRGSIRKRHRDRHLSDNQSCKREDFFQCTIL